MTFFKKDIVPAKIKFALASMILFMLMIANPASAKIIVWCDSVKEPVAVRYGWANNPICNLYQQRRIAGVAF
ncbi:MAG: hypothetical protein H0W75_06090 [Chitinophagaceae bacterium]|nr:hypothetical protein [Chitinophagaceae bacterium]